MPYVCVTLFSRHCPGALTPTSNRPPTKVRVCVCAYLSPRTPADSLCRPQLGSGTGPHVLPLPASSHHTRQPLKQLRADGLLCGGNGRCSGRDIRDECSGADLEGRQGVRGKARGAVRGAACHRLLINTLVISGPDMYHADTVLLLGSLRA